MLEPIRPRKLGESSLAVISAHSLQVIPIKSSEEILFCHICLATLLAILPTMRIIGRRSSVLLALLACMYWLTAAWVMPNLVATSACDRPYLSTSSPASSDLKAGKNARAIASQRNSTSHRSHSKLLWVLVFSIAPIYITPLTSDMSKCNGCGDY